MQRSCFVLTPFSSPFNEYYQEVLAPAIRKAGLEPLRVRADGIYGTGPIIDDIVDGIKSSVAVVADVTGRNPNVNYELGLAHAFGRPVVILSQSVDDIPFDYRYVRAITYETKLPKWAGQLQEKIVASLKSCRPLRLGSQEHEMKPTDDAAQSGGYGSYYTDPAFPVRGLHHVSLPVRNLDASMGFYYETLCLRKATDPEVNRPERKRPDDFGFRGEWFEFPDGQQLHLIQYDEKLDMLATFRDSGKVNFKDVHLAVRVRDYNAMEERLIKRNVEIIPGPLQNQCYILDPDFHIIEIAGFEGPGPKRPSSST